MTPHDKLVAKESAAIAKSYSKGKMQEAICWKCERSCGEHQCSWAKKFEPCASWGPNAYIKKRNSGEELTIVTDCPEFRINPADRLDMREVKTILINAYPERNPYSIKKMTYGQTCVLLEAYNKNKRKRAGVCPLIMLYPQDVLPNQSTGEEDDE